MSFLRDKLGKKQDAAHRQEPEASEKQNAAHGQEPEASKRISTLKAMGEWGGILASRDGGAVEDLYGGSEVPAGEWLYFLHQDQALPDGRHIFSNTACFWVTIPMAFSVPSSSGLFSPIPEEMKAFIIQDGSYAEWKDAFSAIEEHLSNHEYCSYQWSWRTEQVKRFMAGECPDWVSR